MGNLVGTLGRVLRNREMRRALAGWMFGWAAEYAWLVALFVYAFNGGGLLAVGILGLTRTLPAALAAPGLSSLADAFPRHRVLLVVHSGRCLVLATAALVAALDGPPLAIFVLAAADAMLGVLHRPTHISLLPALARSPEDLVYANAASSTVEAIGTLAGPIIGALVVATGVVPVMFAIPAATFALAALSVAGLQPASRPVVTGSGRPSVLGGLRALRRGPHAALILGLLAAQTTVRGVLSVLIVAGAIEMLGMGEQGVGFLNAAIGAGGLIGALTVMAVMGHGRLAGPFVLGMVLWGTPILLTGAFPQAVLALGAMAVLGAGNAILDVAAFTLLQRTVPNAARGSVFGLLEALVMLTVGAGAILGPLLVELVGLRGAWIAAGAVLPALAVVAWRGVSAADANAVVPERELAVLRDVPMLRVLPLTAIEQLAGDLQPMRFAPGEPIIRRGEVGDRFYVIAEGEVEVRVDDRVLRRQGSGEAFGEVALLRDVPRTADVVALTGVELFSIGREAFVSAVTGDHQGRDAADEVIAARLSAG